MSKKYVNEKGEPILAALETLATIHKPVKETYNGWTNWETWLVWMWMEESEGTYLFWMEFADGATDPQELGNQINESWKDQLPENAGLFTDFAIQGLKDVNWPEIGETLINRASEKGGE